MEFVGCGGGVTLSEQIPAYQWKKMVIVDAHDAGLLSYLEVVQKTRRTLLVVRYRLASTHPRKHVTDDNVPDGPQQMPLCSHGSG